MEPLVGIEPTTYSLRMNCSTPELQRRLRSFLGDCGIENLRLQKTKSQHKRFISREWGLAILIWHNVGNGSKLDRFQREMAENRGMLTLRGVNKEQ